MNRITGIIIIKLISSPSQATSHELADTATKVPIKRTIKYKKIKFLNNIKKEDCTLIEGVWTL